jgi:hypothetical protein
MIILLLAVALLAPRDEFFIISSVDASHGRIVVKRPTEVTAVLTVPLTATLKGERGETLHIADLRSGDTIYAVLNPSLIVTSIRRGPMTVDELRRRYLHDLPADIVRRQ